MKNSNYFNEETEKSVAKFQDEKDPEKRKIIFEKELMPAFSKLIENVIFVYKFNMMR